jgi:ribosomal protein L40E
MRCQNCSAENPQGAKFCIQCATPIRRRCQKCGFENPSEARFCAQCATSLTGDQVEQLSNAAASSTSSGIRVTLDNPEPQALDGERKTVTALFADIKGSTELMRDLDPEEARAIVDPVLQLMTSGIVALNSYMRATCPRPPRQLPQRSARVPPWRAPARRPSPPSRARARQTRSAPAVPRADVEENKVVSEAQLIDRLKLAKSTVSYRVKSAISGGWLINLETRRGYPVLIHTHSLIEICGLSPHLKSPGVSLEFHRFSRVEA